MGNSTVNNSFKDDLLNQIDDVARAGSRSRSELILKAARMYIVRKNWWKSIYKNASLNGNQLVIQVLLPGQLIL